MPDSAPDTALESRTGLPDALRVLLAEYPRAGWPDDAGYDGLIRFWLDRHLMFRRLIALLQDETEKLIDHNADPQRFAQALSRYGGMFVSELHGHHQIEDAHYFPVLSQRDARVAGGFDILDRDHHALDSHLDGFVKGANAVLGRLDDQSVLQTRAGRFHTELARLGGFLDRHLTDEEELIVPVILKFGTAGLG